MINKDDKSTFLQGVIRSYSQIFFSESYCFAVPLALVSFLDISAGFCGLIAVIISNIVAILLKFDRFSVSKGYYGFNSLLVGLGLGYYYELTMVMVVIAIISGFLTLLITIVLQGVLGKYYLPYLSLPFVLSIWIVLSAGAMVPNMDNQNGLYILNRLFSIGGHPLVNIHQWWINNITSVFINGYFLSLGAIFFQFNVFAGIIVAISILIYSRISFLLSLIGYGIAYAAYTFLGTDMTQLGYSFIGFNFILGAIAIGGYFYISSKYSFFWAIAITPVIALAAAGLSGLIKPLNLKLFSLPFNIIVISFIYAFRFRTSADNFTEVQIQEGTPERNLYSYKSFVKRFPDFGKVRIRLPFFGEWAIDQGHYGEYTHKDEWAHAWDFIIIGSDGSHFQNSGTNYSDYLCYGQNVIAPADGTVIVTEDGISDNVIGEINILKNWGNSVIIKHTEGLFSKVCHLQNGSIIVKPGEYVQCGQVIGKVGNSGRSPYPHLHFQLQATPYIGAKTLKYPLFSYLEDDKEIKTFNYPVKGQKIRNIEANILLKKAFNLMSGTKLKWNVCCNKVTKSVSWEVFSSLYNKSYIICNETKSTAGFEYDGVNFYFTWFSGKRDSLLYYFYLAAFRIPVTCIEGFITRDSLPVNMIFGGVRMALHDFTASFFQYLKVDYEVFEKKDGPEFDPEKIEYFSHLSGYSFKKKIWYRDFHLTVYKNNSLKIENEQLNLEAVCESY
jgi:urea transporter